jgi:hypothetical protein
MTAAAGAIERLDLEAVREYRLARLLVVLAAATNDDFRLDTIDRVAYIEFFASNPYPILSEDKREQGDRANLAVAGFARRQLSYNSVGHRFASRRRAIQHDMASLLAVGFLEIGAGGYGVTERGRVAADQIESAYADALRTATEVVIRRIGKLSGKKLVEVVELALGRSWLLLDLLDDVREVEVSDELR